MTKSEKRKARKQAQREGRPLTGDLEINPQQPCHEFSESPKGYEARHRWAKSYDALNGAPEGDWDR